MADFACEHHATSGLGRIEPAPPLGDDHVHDALALLVAGEQFTGDSPSSDAPSQCQTPNRRIVANYASGGYVDPNATPPASTPTAAAPVQPPPNRGAAVQAKAQAEATVQVSVCVPGDLTEDWTNPPPGSKMETLQRQLKASLRERYDPTKWMAINLRIYSTWDPTGPFRDVVTAIDGGRCAVGRHEFLALTP